MLLSIEYMSSDCIIWQYQYRMRSCKTGEIWDEFYSAYCRTRKKLHNPLLKPQWVHLRGSVSKISALPRLWDQPIQGFVFNWTGKGKRGEPGDKAKGGWGRIYDLSTFLCLIWVELILISRLERQFEELCCKLLMYCSSTMNCKHFDLIVATCLANVQVWEQTTLIVTLTFENLYLIWKYATAFFSIPVDGCVI